MNIVLNVILSTLGSVVAGCVLGSLLFYGFIQLCKWDVRRNRRKRLNANK